MPWIPDDPFESSLDLEWPIEGLEPLSFVLADCSNRWPAGSSAPIAARRFCTRICAVVERPCMRARCSCRRRCAIRRHCARCCCSISNRIRRRPAIDRVRAADRAHARARHPVDVVRARAAITRAGLHPARATDGADGREPRRLAAAGGFVEAGAFAMTPFAVRPANARRSEPRDAARGTWTATGSPRRRVSPVPPARPGARAGPRRPSGAHHDRSPRRLRRPDHPGGRPVAHVGRVVERHRRVALRSNPKRPGIATSGMSRSPTARSIASTSNATSASGSSKACSTKREQ